MSRTRMAIIAFWVVIIGLLIWEFTDFNSGMTKEAIEHPKQAHFFFFNTNKLIKPTAPVHEGAYVQQIGFDVLPNTPSNGMFTCRVTLKNMGTAHAKEVQIKVAPYRGIALGDLDNGHHKEGTLADNDPNAQIGQWVNFSDLAPGESATKTTTFITRTDISPGGNPNPDIIYQTDKAKDEAAQPAPSAPSPAMPPRQRINPND